MAGGHATQSGIELQNNVAAVLAVHVLAEAPLTVLGIPSNIIPLRIHAETTSPVDDLVIELSDGGTCFINVKRNVRVSSTPSSPLGSVIDQFVRQWLAGKTGAPLDPSRDRLVLVTAGEEATALLAASAALKNRHQTTTPAPTTEEQARVLAALHSLIEHYWSVHTNQSPSHEDVSALLKIVSIVRIDPDGLDKAPILALIRQSVAASPNDAETIWNALINRAQFLARNRASADRTSLITALSGQGLKLKCAPSLAPDIEKLRKYSSTSLQHIEHLAHLLVPTQSGAQVLEIERHATAALVESATRQSFLVIGLPGSGKSAAIHAAAIELSRFGHPVIVLPVDRHPVSTLEELEQGIGLEHPLADVLASWNDDKAGVLFIDALDASRGGASDRVFQKLVRQVLTRAPNWRVVCSIREFDLRFGVTYRDLFEGRPVNDELEHKDFPTVKHLAIPPLATDELEQVWRVSPAMGKIYSAGSKELKELLRSPFNLFLFASVLRKSGATASQLAATTTQVELLRLYWNYRVVQDDRQQLARERLLSKLIASMIDQRRLSADTTIVEVSEHEPLLDLLSNGVLSRVAGRADRLNEIAFSHHVLFDYSVSRLRFQDGTSPAFADDLTAADDRALLLAPAAMYAFRALWEEDTTRRAFWSRAVSLAGATSAGAFCRMLPARVAADVTEKTSDWSALFTVLATPHAPETRAVQFLVRHSLGAIAADVIGRDRVLGSGAREWTAITRWLAENRLADSHFPIRILLAYCLEDVSSATMDQARDLSIAAVLLLKRGKQDSDDADVAVGIRTLVQTYWTYSPDAIQALHALLEPGNLREWGYSELFSLTQDARSLLRDAEGRNFLAALYMAAYCTPLPDSREDTTIGNSRILPLRSNKRQDFESARHILGEKFTLLFEADATLATKVTIRALECYERVERLSDKTETHSLRVSGRDVQFQPDWSYMWRDFRGSDALKLFAAFRTGLCKLMTERRANEIDNVLEVVFRKNRLAGIWGALLEAATKAPDLAKDRLGPLLENEVVLQAAETRKQCGDLLAVLHPMLDHETKERVESAIMRCSPEQTRNVLLGCLSPTDMVHTSAITAREQLARGNSLPPNDDTFSFASYVRGGNEGWWLREQGIDETEPLNAKIIEATKNISDAVSAARNQKNDPSLASIWDRAVNLLSTLQTRPDLPEALRMKGWDCLAEAADAATTSAEKSADLAAFPQIDSMVEGALSPSNWPAPISDPKIEENFARGPSWSSPSPRIAGASAIMALARARGAVSENHARLIRLLVDDPHPAVRHQISTRVNVLFNADRDLMWELVEHVFETEHNVGSLTFFLNTLGRILHVRPEWLTEKLISFEREHDSPDDSKADDPTEPLVNLLLRAWLWIDVVAAGKRIHEFVSAPFEFERQLTVAITALRTAITIGDLRDSDPIAERIRKRAANLFFEVTHTALNEVNHGIATHNGNPEIAKRVESGIKIIDRVASEIYFGSGAYQSKDRSVESAEQETAGALQKRFLQEYGPTLNLLTQAPYPSITHHLLETLEAFISIDPVQVFRLVSRALLSGGKAGGYQFESLGIAVFVRIVRRYLAEFRFVFTLDKECRSGLIQSLDVFVEVGWPDARRLVYELPEMLR
jgi:hypothetical protein